MNASQNMPDGLATAPEKTGHNLAWYLEFRNKLRQRPRALLEAKGLFDVSFWRDSKAPRILIEEDQ